MIKDTVVHLKGGRPDDTGRVLITSCIRRDKVCLVLWQAKAGDLRYSWEREGDLVIVKQEMLS